MTTKPVLVVGAGGALGLEIVRRLRAEGRKVLASYRTVRTGTFEALAALGAEAVRLDLDDPETLSPALARCGAAVFTPILTVSVQAAARLDDAQAAVFFSSNNVAVDPQAPVYARLTEAEAQARRAAPHAVILRPTMIYGYPGDGNLSKLMAAMRRAPFMPMPGRGAALQQPIFFRDLAAIAAETLFDPAARGSVRACAGPEAATMRALYEAAAAAAGTGARPLGLPLEPAGTLLRWAEKAGLRLPVSAAQLRRASLDKTPRGEPVVIGATPLKQGLAALAAALDVDRPGA